MVRRVPLSFLSRSLGEDRRVLTLCVCLCVCVRLRWDGDAWGNHMYAGHGSCLPSLLGFCFVYFWCVAASGREQRSQVYVLIDTQLNTVINSSHARVCWVFLEFELL